MLDDAAVWAYGLGLLVVGELGECDALACGNGGRVELVFTKLVAAQFGNVEVEARPWHRQARDFVGPGFARYAKAVMANGGRGALWQRKE